MYLSLCVQELVYEYMSDTDVPLLRESLASIYQLRMSSSDPQLHLQIENIKRVVNLHRELNLVRLLVMIMWTHPLTVCFIPLSRYI